MSQKSITKHKLDDTERGWFIGNFDPTLFRTEVVEVAVKHYKAGDVEKSHYHKVATEFTVVVSGEIKLNDEVYKAGDIAEVPQQVHSAFEALTDAVLTVVKLPGKKNDKFYTEDNA